MTEEPVKIPGYNYAAFVKAWTFEDVRLNADSAIAHGRAALIKSVFGELQVGLAYCKLAAFTSDARWKTRYQERGQASLSEALNFAALTQLESEAKIHNDFVAAATLLQRALAELDARTIHRPEKRQTPKSKHTRRSEIAR